MAKEIRSAPTLQVTHLMRDPLSKSHSLTAAKSDGLPENDEERVAVLSIIQLHRLTETLLVIGCATTFLTNMGGIFYVAGE